MARNVSLLCPKLGEIEVPLEGSRIIKFSAGGKVGSRENGGLVLSTPCPCCQFSHFKPITAQEKSTFVSYGVQVTSFSQFRTGNVPERKRKSPTRNSEADMEKIVARDIRKLNAPVRFRTFGNGDCLENTLKKWAQDYSRNVSSLMRNRTQPFAWRTFQGR